MCIRDRGYTVTPCEKEACGTDVIPVIKDDEGEEHYSEFLDDWRLAGLVKKYSDYIRWPCLLYTSRCV